MKGFQSRLPAARWEEGLLCGNGTIGAMVMGWPKEETIYFTHEKLYAPFAPKREPVHTAGHLEAIRRNLSGFRNFFTRLIRNRKTKSRTFIQFGFRSNLST